VRALTALLSLVAFANLSLVQASGFCPLAGGDAHAPAASAMGHHGEHVGHGTGSSNADTIDEAPVTDSGHPSCLMKGPCGLSVDVGRMVAAALSHHADGVRATLDSALPSLTTSPDIPPPRA
jgi:hypothetical protein